jgi:hypothetical protein
MVDHLDKCGRAGEPHVTIDFAFIDGNHMLD